MRFTEISIFNFRQYRDILFSFPKTTGCDIHIIEASNGVGKTNLLNAINWCLYGDEPHLSGSNEPEYHKGDRLSVCNQTALDEAKNNGESACPVTVTIKAESDEGEFEFKREQRINVHTFLQVGKDNFEVRVYPKSGEMKLYSEKEGELLVDQYMPKKIREYFYFDGERLLNYLTNTDSTVSKIRDSIYEIAGVNFINRSSEHLQEFVSQFQKKVTELSPDLISITNEMNAAIEAVANQQQEIEQLSQQIAQAEDAIAKADEILAGNERSREANEKYNANKRLIEREEQDLKESKAALSEFVRKYFAKIMLYSVNKEALQYIAQREEQSAINPEVNFNAIKNSLDKHECSLCSQHIPHDLEEELKKLLLSYEANVSLQTLIGIKSDIIRAMNVSDYETEKNKIFDRIRRSETSIEALQSENDQLWLDIEAVGNIKDLELASAQKKENEELRALNLEKRGRYRENLDSLKKKQAEKTAKYDEAVDKNEKCSEYKIRTKFVSRALGIVKSVKDNIIEDIKKQMENETMDIFNKLLWKKDTYGRVEIDEDFRIHLYHKQSGQSCLYTCSAAEKELLALSFTIALQNVSGYDNLLFIDTPVGRVSDVNRENFAEVLLDVSQNKQIILTFTPSEYSQEIKTVLNPSVISSYNKLSFSNEVTEKEDK